MSRTECVFCKIANKDLPADVIYEDKDSVAFKDINPKAPVHFLVIPRKHIVSVDSLLPEDRELMGDLLLAAQKIAKNNKISGYKLVINVGREGGQLVDHLHVHFLSGNSTECLNKNLCL